MPYPLNYRRPPFVPYPDSSRDSLSGDEKQKSIDESITSGSSGMSAGIPEALSFDRIIAGGVCPVRSKISLINDPILILMCHFSHAPSATS
jgi:hypothetical protein